MNNLLPDGFKLLILGLISVLSFIGIMVLTMQAIAWALERIKRKPAMPKTATPKPCSADQDEEIAAALAAMCHHRANTQIGEQESA